MIAARLSGGRSLMYWLLSHSSFCSSKTAPFRLMSSSRKAAVISSRVIFSLASPGDQPRRARKLNVASGRYPWSRYSVTETAPCLLLSRFLSGPRMSGRWANRGGAAPAARYRRTCFGVLLMWSSPRITCVTRISMSSETQERL
jgi:hypothetical protein